MKKSKKKEGIRLKELPENVQVIDVPDDVYVSSTGRYYYPEPTTKAKVKIELTKAKEKGYKPSKAYIKFLVKCANQQKEAGK